MALSKTGLSSWRLQCLVGESLQWGTIMRRVLAGLALSLAFAATSAQADTHTLNLTGNALDTLTNSFTIGLDTYDTGVLALSGFTPFTLADGDTLEIVVDLTNGPFNVPVRQFMYLGLNFSDDMGNVPPGTYSANGNFSFDGGADLSASCGNCTSLIYYQENATLSFTQLIATGVVGLSAPYDVSSITLSYQVNDTGVPAGVPEPGAWALMILGFGAAGGALRRRRNQTAFAAA